MFGVERRHFNDLVKILKTDVLKWKSFYEALDIDPVEMFSTTQKLLKGDIQPAEAYRDALDIWKEISGRKATFGILELVLRNILKWDDAAGKKECRLHKNNNIICSAKVFSVESAIQ